jgi:hypothetical protein
MEILGRFTRGDGGGVVMPLYVRGFAEYQAGVCWVVRCCGLLGKSKLSVPREILRVRVYHLVVCGCTRLYVVWACIGWCTIDVEEHAPNIIKCIILLHYNKQLGSC